MRREVHGVAVGRLQVHHEVLSREDGEIDGQKAKIKRDEESLDVLYNLHGAVHDHLVTPDGVNADYVREHGAVVVDKREFIIAEKEGYIREAEQLVRVEKFHDGHQQVQRLRARFKEAGFAGTRTEPDLRRRFEAAISRFYETQSRRREEREKRFTDAANKKRALVTRARQIADSSDWKNAGDQLRSLMDEWKRVGTAGKQSESQLWAEFNEARARFRDRRTRHFHQRDKEREASRSKKQRLVGDANAIASSSDLRLAFQRMRDLRAQWNAAGSAGRDHEEHLWRDFQAAQDRLYTRAEEGRSRAEQTKRAIVQEASSIAAYGDLHDAGNQMRNLMTRWRAAGHAGRAAEDALWSSFLSYRRQLDARYDQRRSQSAEKTRDFVRRLEEAADRKRGHIARIEGYIAEVYARPPVRPGPLMYEIIAKRETKISNLSAKRDSIAQSLREIEAKLVEVRTRM